MISKRIRWLALAALGCVMVACGGGGSGPSIPDSGSGSTSREGGSSAPGASGQSGAPAADGANSAVVVVGDDRYEVSDVSCFQAGPAGIAVFLTEDPMLFVTIPSEDWESSGSMRWPEIQVMTGGKEWRASAGDAATFGGSHGVGDFTLTGSWESGWRASGTAVFNEQMDTGLGDAIPGSFDVTCYSALAETSDDNTAVLTIGDERHELGRLWCRSFFGVLAVQTIDRDPELSIELYPPAVGDPSTVSLRYNDGTGWQVTELDEFDLSGDSESGFRATGRGTFLEQGVFDGTAEERAGTVEMSCGRTTS